MPETSRNPPPAAQVIKGFCAKADGKDKLTALVQVRRSSGESRLGGTLRAAVAFPQPPSVLAPAGAQTLTTTNRPRQLLQYACLFASAGEPGNLKKVQASVTAARKVFRIMRVSSGG